MVLLFLSASVLGQNVQLAVEPDTTASSSNQYVYQPVTTGVPADGWILSGPSWLGFSNAGGIISTAFGDAQTGFNGDGAADTTLIFSAGTVHANASDLFWIDVNNNRLRVFNQDSNWISTVAGNGTQTYTGDGGPALQAGMWTGYWSKIKVDSSGNLVFVDDNNYVVRSIDAATGVIETVVGSGSSLFNGDSVLATTAGVRPVDIAWLPSGELLLADRTNARLRKLASNGTLITIAGTGGTGCSGDGGQAILAELGVLEAITVSDAGDIYLAANHTIRKISSGTGVIETICGTGVAGYNGDGIPATAAQLNTPVAMALRSGVELLIADRQNHAVRSINLGSNIISTIAGTPGSSGFGGDGGPAGSSHLDTPTDIAVDSIGNIFIADVNNNRVRKISGPSWQLTGTPTCADIGPHPVTIAVTDGVDTVYQSFTIHVVDSTPPQITCPNDIVESSSTTFCGAQVSWAPPSGADDCSIATTLQTDSTGLTPGNFFPVGTTEIEYTSTDSIGNAQTCAFTITVVDSTPPELTCPSDTTVHVTNGNCEAAVTFIPPHGSDLCSTPTTVQTDATGLSSGDNFPLGTTQLEYTATDTSGNAQTCQLNITVIDTIPPTITCPDSIATGNPIVNFSDPAVTDNCFGSTLNQTDGTGLSSGSTFPFGLTVLEYTATDQAGNTTICTLPILVDTTISVSELTDAGSLSVFPNPNAGSFTITLPQTTGTLTLTIHNTLGEQVLSQRINAAGSIAQVQLPRTAKGIYFLRLSSSSEQWQERIVVR